MKCLKKIMCINPITKLAVLLFASIFLYRFSVYAETINLDNVEIIEDGGENSYYLDSEKIIKNDTETNATERLKTEIHMYSEDTVGNTICILLSVGLGAGVIFVMNYLTELPSEC